MSPLVKILLRLAIIVAAIFFITQPYNWFCQITGKCQPFFFSYYIPKKLGRTIYLAVNAITYKENLFFSASKPVKIGSNAEGENEENKFSTNQKIEVIYTLKNNSKKLMQLQPRLLVQPEYAEKYLIRYECPCSRKYKLKAGEEIEMKMRFEIDSNIEKDEKFKQKELITINYKI